MVTETLTDALPSQGSFGTARQTIFRNLEQRKIQIKLVSVSNKSIYLNAFNLYKVCPGYPTALLTPWNLSLPASHQYLSDDPIILFPNERIDAETARDTMDYRLEGVSIS